MLTRLRVENFRCIESASLAFDPAWNVVGGQNGSGKTSLLEAVYCLSRGRSFRSARRDHAIRYGSAAFTLFGEISNKGRPDRVGLEIGRQARRIRINGQDTDRVGDLARFLPVHLIDPTVHELIDGGPEVRRRYLDFGVFHVEQGFLKVWSDYRRAMAQRNGALRAGCTDSELDTWDLALADLAVPLAEARGRHAEAIASRLPATVETVLPESEVTIEHRQGWSPDTSLAALLKTNRDRDRATGITQDGAHRADLKISFRERMARHQVSRGQQKLVAASLVLAQMQEIGSRSEREPVLLMDDPAAELDTDRLVRLFAAIKDVPCQRLLTALEPGRLPLPTDARMFHVEHGVFTED